MAKLTLKLEGLNCANCANQIEEAIAKTDGVNDAKVNLIVQRVSIIYDSKTTEDEVFQNVERIVMLIEPEVDVIKEEKERLETKYFLKNLNCAHCAQDIEDAVLKLDYIKSANVNLVNQYLLVDYSKKVSAEQAMKDFKMLVGKIEEDIEVQLFEMHRSEAVTAEDGRKIVRNQFFEQLRKIAAPLGIAVGFFLAANFLNVNSTLQILFFLSSYLIFAFPIIKKAVKNLLNGQILDENFLMSVASIGAIFLGEYTEAIAVVFLYQVGEFFQEVALNNSRASIKDLLDIKPVFARIVNEKNETEEIRPEDVEIGAIVQIRAGERIPLDGIVVSGEALIDTKSITGEPTPIVASKGKAVLSGSINLNAVIEIKTTESYDNSTVSKVLEMVEYATDKKAPIDNFMTKFSKVYTPAVVFAAIILAFVVPFFTDRNFSYWIKSALTFLVVSCPCAMVISIPLTFFSGIGEASKRGILVKGGNYLQALSEAKQVVFDKTGTLTKGEFKVSKLSPENSFTKEQLIHYAAIAESSSNHPIALSIMTEYGKLPDVSVESYEEIAGKGIKVAANSEMILAGNKALMQDFGVKINEYNGFGSVVYVAVDKVYAGYIAITDEIKEDSKESIKRMRQIGINNISILTGDKKEEAEKIAEILNVDSVFAELLPHEKVSTLEILMQKNNKGKTVFVGDGLNDAPVLKLADVGIALGGVGSEAAIEACDVVLMTDEPSKIIDAITISKNTMKLLKQNIIFSVGVKFIVLGLSVFGFANMAMAIFADVGVTLLAILNAMRKKI